MAAARPRAGSQDGWGDLAAAWCAEARDGTGRRACWQCIAAADAFKAAVGTAHPGAMP